ncbi:uncharacterized protein K452DRAFT_267866 [Aplosporella prunicola CBS 121167]|uniref:DNA damage-binding protein 1 n=1 Tax=Aplosporella prunicola CBS 121167 TaxID=1176127 RepID=A0A6A6BJ09_9PEZI|nr:uncharacterized protein K452DRAFT_267866 [Aplosporella prunicola CBS 121167]KAF2143628.1 hypothetical protein K452DRAFT_267866 [Aplosporella prunicola CBS 121167]
MAYLAPIHRPSSVRHAIKLSFLAPDDECLIVAKANRLEIYQQTDDGLSLHASKALHGKVSMLNKLRPAGSSTDHLFVGTDQQTFFTLSWDAEARQLRTEKSFVDLADQASRDSQTGDRCLVDPTGRFMALELYEGITHIIPLTGKGKRRGHAEISVLGEPVPCRIPEMSVRSSAFLHRKTPDTDKPLLALLHDNTESDQTILTLRQLTFQHGASGEQGTAELETVEGPAEVKEMRDWAPSHLIPIAEPSFGLLVLGETRIAYLNDQANQFMEENLEEATIFVAWEQIDNQRFVLADEYGRLFLLMLLLKNDNSVAGWNLDVIGQTSKATVLVYLDAGYVYVGSHEGDSQVLRIAEKSIEVVQTFSNIAPILDFTIMDMGNRSGEGQGNEYSSGQARIVTGSGAYQDGSLRSVRSGVGLEDQGALGEIGNISTIFSLKSTSASEYDDTLLVSLIEESRVFCFDSEGQVEEVDDFKGLLLSEATLLASNLPGGRLLQITHSSVRLTDLENGMVISEWHAPAGRFITDVDANDRYAFISLEGIQAIILSITDTVQVHTEKEVGAKSQVSCVAIPKNIEGICIVGFFQTCEVSILNVDDLSPVQTIQLATDGSSIPRSLLLTNIFEGQPATLFVATGDGNVVTLSVDPSTYALSGKKSTVLGTQQASFRALPRGGGLYNVFATCEHPSLIYGSEGRLVYSAVTAEKASCVCPFDAEAFPGSIAIASSGELHLAMVDTERTTHVQSLIVNETVRRIAYSPALKAFALGCINRTLKDGEELVQGHIKLVDEIAFKELHTVSLKEYELVESIMRCELDNGSGGLTECFVVGTSYLEDEDMDNAGNARGRIIVFEVTGDRTFKVVAELAVKGACRCLAMMEGRIVAALYKTVVVYSFDYGSGSTPGLTKKTSYRTATAPADMTVSGNQIIVGDMMKSICILEYKPDSTGLSGQPDHLNEVARHYAVSWTTAVAEVDDNTYLEADSEGNLTVLYREMSGVTEEDRRRLVPTSEICLGELVNRIRRIDVMTAPDAAVIPRAFLATVEGSIYLVALIAEGKRNLLMNLQAKLAEFLQSPGNMPFNKYRAYRTEVRKADEPMRFVDGEIVERFLDCPPDVQEQVVQGLDVDVEDVRAMVEALRRLH